MTYITGDIHGSPVKIQHFCRRMNLTAEDTIIILGDVGVNYFGDRRDDRVKERLAALAPTIFCIHGNHERRPATVAGYELSSWNDGAVWVQDKYQDLLFAKDGEIFNIEGIRYLVIGGAYSVDKYYRLSRGAGWWADEQPSPEIKADVERAVAAGGFDIILSHTCPFKYEPVEVFLPMIDQSTVDDSTERWFDEIEEKADYKAWFCGHWHTDKRIDRMHFLFDGFECAEDLRIPVEPDDETFAQVARDILDRHKEAFKKLGE